MCFISLPPKNQKGISKKTSKVSLEGTCIVLGPGGARFSFPDTSKLPSNLFVRQDFYGTDKAQVSIPDGASTQVYGHYIPAQGQSWAQYGPIPVPLALRPTPTLAQAGQPTGADLVSAVSEAQRVACNLKDACLAHSACSSRSPSSHSSRSRSHSQSRSRDRETLLLSIERKNAEEIAALKLERDIEQKIKDVVTKRDVRALVTAAAGSSGGMGGLGYGGGGGGGGSGGGNAAGIASWGNASEAWAWSPRAQLELESENRLLRERERERERDRIRDGERRSIGAAGPGAGAGDAQLQFNLFQDLSGGGGGSGSAIRGCGRGGFVDGIRDGWERRRSSVVSTLDRGARRLADAMARVEAEVEGLRRRERRTRGGLY